MGFLIQPRSQSPSRNCHLTVYFNKREEEKGMKINQRRGYLQLISFSWSVCSQCQNIRYFRNKHFQILPSLPKEPSSMFPFLKKEMLLFLIAIMKTNRYLEINLLCNHIKQACFIAIQK